jgi:hypothetical protein
MIMGKKARQKIIKEFDKKIVLDAYQKAIQNISKDAGYEFNNYMNSLN